MGARVYCIVIGFGRSILASRTPLEEGDEEGAVRDDGDVALGALAEPPVCFDAQIGGVSFGLVGVREIREGWDSREGRGG